jgi:hypothetical protein
VALASNSKKADECDPVGGLALRGKAVREYIRYSVKFCFSCWVLPNWCSCGFSLLLLLCVFSIVISTQCTWDPLAPKSTTTRLKATARPPLGVASRGGAVWPRFTARLCVLVQILPFAIARDNRVSRVCSSEFKTKPLPVTVTPTRLPLQSSF